MSRYHGLLLFDIADRPIGQWEENLGTRGMFDEWETKDGRYFIRCEQYEDCEHESHKEENCTESEVWWGDNKTGACDSIFFGAHKQAIREMKRFMRENKKGID